MKIRRAVSSILSGALLAVGLAGCVGGPEGTSIQGLTTIDGEPQAAAATPEARTHRGGPRHGRGAFQGDGPVALASLPEALRTRMQAADRDQDGTLTAQERTAFRQVQQQERFAQADHNSDGALTADEAGEAGWQRLSHADADHDGRVTREELTAAHGAHGFGPHGRPGQGPRGPRGPIELASLPEGARARLQAADSNQDGTVSAEELAAAHPGMHRGHGARRAPAPAPAQE